MRTQASSRHMRMSHTGPNTHPPGGGKGGGEGSGGWGKRACSEPCPPPTKRQIESWPPRERRSCSGRRWLKWQTRPSHVGTGRLRHTRAKSVHTHIPHHTPHAHTLGQHIGYEGGHPPTQGPHQQSMDCETGAGRWEEVGVDARGHCDARAGTRESTRSLTTRHTVRWGGDTRHPVTNPTTHHEHPQVAMRGVER